MSSINLVNHINCDSEYCIINNVKTMSIVINSILHS